jgi:hypothetical protein
MFKFTRLYVDDIVASTSVRCWKKLSSIFKLPAPTLLLRGDELRITDDSGRATSFDILVGGTIKGTTTTTTFDLAPLHLEPGFHNVTVIAKADGCIDSPESKAVSYEGDELAGTWIINASAWTKTSTPEITRCNFLPQYGGATMYGIENGEIVECKLYTFDIYGTSNTSTYYYYMYDTTTYPRHYNAGWINSTGRTSMTARYKIDSAAETEQITYYADSERGRLLNTIKINCTANQVSSGSGKTLLKWLKANATKIA